MKKELDDIETFGIDEAEFKKLFQFKSVYSVNDIKDFMNPSKIYNYTQFKQIINKILEEKPFLKTIKCLLHLNSNQLIKGNLKKEYQQQLFMQSHSYNSLLLIISTNYSK